MSQAPENDLTENKSDCIEECLNSICEGSEFYDCIDNSDGCKILSYMGVVKGKCGVECIKDAECSDKENCINHKCYVVNSTNERHDENTIKLIIEFDKKFDAVSIMRSPGRVFTENIKNGRLVINDESFCSESGQKNITLMSGDMEVDYYWDLSETTCENGYIYLGITEEDIQMLNAPISDRWPHNLITPNEVRKYLEGGTFIL